jgi:hypothetical protein
MSDITIEVWDATGNKKQLVQLPADAAVNRVIAVLVRKMNLPEYSPDGQLMSYKFQHRATGRQLLDSETLSSAGVHDGDIVRLQPEITAGALKRAEAGRFLFTPAVKSSGEPLRKPSVASTFSGCRAAWRRRANRFLASCIIVS